jgi:hypothetical protein
VTGDVSPAGQPDESRPELRASHADRDRVVEQLRIAAGDGRLTADELDERLEAALTARTYRELAALTADLPAAGQAGLTRAKPKDVLRITHHGGSARQVGRWVVPKRIEIQVTGGNVLLDFTEAVITADTLEVETRMRGGTLVVVTRPGVVVDTSEVSTVGGQIVNRPPDEPDRAVDLAVEVSGQLFGGNVRVRGRHRTFSQWLRRESRPPR